MTSPGVQPSSKVSGYETVHTSGSGFGQDLTESSIRNMLSVRTVNPFEKFTTNLVKGIADAIRGISGLGSLFWPIREATQEFRDGQDALNDRTDLLSPLLDYGSCYAPNDETRLHGPGVINFSRQIGPMRGCHLEGNTLVLDDKGLWDIRAHVVLDAMVTLLYEPYMYANVNVYRPDGSLYSQQSSTMSGAQTTSCTIVSSVVVPSAGYRVQVSIDKLDNVRGIKAGPRWSRLVVQHISRSTSIGDSGTETSTPAG